MARHWLRQSSCSGACGCEGSFNCAGPSVKAGAMKSRALWGGRAEVTVTLQFSHMKLKRLLLQTANSHLLSQSDQVCTLNHLYKESLFALPVRQQNPTELLGVHWEMLRCHHGTHVLLKWHLHVVTRAQLVQQPEQALLTQTCYPETKLLRRTSVLKLYVYLVAMPKDHSQLVLWAFCHFYF